MFSRLWSLLPLGAVAFCVASVSMVGGLPSQAGTPTEPWIDTSNRDAVTVAYAAEYRNRTPAMNWDGNYETCEPGISSTDLATATVRRVNFYRAMAGVPAKVTLNPDFSEKAQHAALTMSATGRLSHTPDDDFDCLTTTGREAAANSNLYLGRTGPASIDGYIEDPGERNADVGHRNTILHPPTTEIGVGHVAGSATAYPANALWVFDDRVFADNPTIRETGGFVAWPPRGYVPADLVYPRWSLGLADADFEAATVTMTVAGEPIALEVVARLSQQGYVPAPIVVWEPEVDLAAAAAEAGGDVQVEVAVTGVVVDGVEVDFDYTVTIMGDQPSPSELNRSGVERAFRSAGRTAKGLVAAAFDPLVG